MIPSHNAIWAAASLIGLATITTVVVALLVILKRRATYIASGVLMIGSAAILLVWHMLGIDIGPLVVPFALVNIGFIGFTHMAVQIDKKRDESR